MEPPCCECGYVAFEAKVDRLIPEAAIFVNLSSSEPLVAGEQLLLRSGGFELDERIIGTIPARLFQTVMDQRQEGMEMRKLTSPRAARSLSASEEMWSIEISPPISRAFPGETFKIVKPIPYALAAGPLKPPPPGVHDEKWRCKSECKKLDYVVKHKDGVTVCVELCMDGKTILYSKEFTRDWDAALQKNKLAGLAGVVLIAAMPASFSLVFLRLFRRGSAHEHDQGRGGADLRGAPRTFIRQIYQVGFQQSEEGAEQALEPLM